MCMAIQVSDRVRTTCSTRKRRAKSRRARRDVRVYVHSNERTDRRINETSIARRGLRFRREYTRVHCAYSVYIYVLACFRPLALCAVFRGCAWRGAARATNSGVSSCLHCRQLHRDDDLFSANTLSKLESRAPVGDGLSADG